MAAHPASASVEPARDPIADARALVAMAIGLGQRTRTVHRLGQVTDRKAALYVSTIVRHASRLLQSATTHDVPVLRSSASGPGGNAVHFVVRHDRLVGPPSANRFLVVGSDARLRCCIVADHGGARIWADYDVSTAPEGLSLRVVLDALSEIIARLEQTVIQLETRELVREAQVEADIAAAKARIAGLPVDAAPVSRRHARSEEPVRPWTRHVVASETPPSTPASAPAQAPLPPEVARWARPVASTPAAAPAPEAPPVAAHDVPPVAMPEAMTDAMTDAMHDAIYDAIEPGDELVFSLAADVDAESLASADTSPDDRAEPDEPAPALGTAPRRGFTLSRLHKAI